MTGDNNIEVVPDRHGLLVADYYIGRDPEVVQGQSLNSPVFIDEPPLEIKANSPKGQIKIILLVIVALAIMLGGVLGGVLESHANSKLPLVIANGTSTSTSTVPKIMLTNLPPKAPTIRNKTNLATIV